MNKSILSLVGALSLLYGTPAYAATDIAAWLDDHPKVADSIKWEFQRENFPDSYDQKESAKISWPDWSADQKLDLSAAFEAAEDWYASADPYGDLDEDIEYPPENLYADVDDDEENAYLEISPEYAWDMYIRWVAHSLLMEVEGHFPWSVLDYDTEMLRVLFDSTAFFNRTISDEYRWSTPTPWHHNHKRPEGNRGVGISAPPRYTAAFLENAGLLQGTPHDTIVSLLDWSSENVVHFYNGYTYGNMEEHWGYRGPTPTTAIIEGSSYMGDFRHWSAGCHGTTAFWRNVLRAANIPVQIVNRCGHSQAHFMSEGLYVDHGDNVYNSTFTGLGISAEALLIDQVTHQHWFGDNTWNNEDYCSAAEEAIGRQVGVLAGTVETCDDAIDNDGDGDVDCADSDCPTRELHRPLRLIASDAVLGGRLGVEVAIDQGRILAGAQGTSDSAGARGTAYVFRRQPGAGWVEEARLEPSDPNDRDFFASYLGLSGDRALVSAELADGFTGAVYSFARSSSGVWSQDQVLVASDRETGDRFSQNIALQGDVAVIGAFGVNDDSGAAYVFEHDGDEWVELDKLSAPSPELGSTFGMAVALDGDLIAVGARSANVDEGAVFVFRRVAGVWQAEAELLPDDPSYGHFGSTVEIANGRVIVGAPGRRVDDQGSAGAAYVFEQGGGGAWSQIQRLVSPNVQAIAGYGNSMQAAGDRLMVSAYGEDDATGAVYVYDFDGDEYVLSTNLEPETLRQDHRFGGAVAFEGNLIAVGAYGDTSQGPFTGALYVYEDGSQARGRCVAATGEQTGDPAVEVTFTSVLNAGETEVVASLDGPDVPIGFQLGDPATYYEISTTTDYVGLIEVCIDYGAVSYGDENTLQLLHYENGEWVNLCESELGCSLDMSADVICAHTATLSPFVVVESSLFPMVDVAGGNRSVETIFLAQNFSSVGSQVSLDVYMRSPQPNPSWYGQLQLLITLDGAGVNNLDLGTKSLQGLPLDAWSTLTFNLPTATKNLLLSGVHSGRFIAQLSRPSNAPPITLKHLRFAGILTDRAGSAPERSAMPELLSFEGAFDWSAQSGGSVSLVTSPMTHGASALRLNRTSTNAAVKSAWFFGKEHGPIGTKLAFDVYVPSGVSWGDVQATASCGTAMNMWIGSKSVTGGTANQYRRISLTLPSAVRSALSTPDKACSLGLTVNAPLTSGKFHFDNVLFE